MGDDKKGSDEKGFLFLSEQLFRNLLTFYPPSGEVFENYWEAVAQIIRREKFIISSKDARQFRDEVIKMLKKEGKEQTIIGRKMVKIVDEIGSKVEDSLRKDYVEKELKVLEQIYNNDLIPVGKKVSSTMVDFRTNFLETIAHILAWRMREKGDLILMADPQLAGMIGGDEFYRRVIREKRIDTRSFIEIVKRLERNEKGQWFVVKKK